ncbi:MAG TPA: ATP-binding protein [Haliangiales bacterium]|nr:ATP-binding protein [Haliangiales bacterium]
MPTVDALLRLGDRYAALGLGSAARAVWERAGGDPEALRRLAHLCLAAGDARAARRFAEEAAKKRPSPAARLLAARALVAVGEMAAARFAFAAVIEAAGVDPSTKAAAYVGRADVAIREGDVAGAGAHLAAALDELLGPRPANAPAPVDADDARLADELAARASEVGRAADLAERARERGTARGGALFDFCRATLLAAAQAQGEAASDADIEAALERALAADPGSHAVKLRLALRLSRRRYRDPAARARAIALLEDLEAALAGDADLAERARVCFLLAGLYEDDPAARARAEEAYRAGLRLRPRHAAAANNLSLLALAQGDVAAARRELSRALWLDADYDVAWLNAARLLDAGRPSPAFSEEVGAWLDAAEPGAGALAGGPAARLARAASEHATQSIMEALYAKGHRLKNLLGISGARVRAARKAAADELDDKLAELERDLGGLYDEWAAHLRTLQAEGPRLEIVPVNPLVSEVVAAAAEEGRPAVRFTPASALPDLKADRALLREALLNLVVNALDAQETGDAKDRAVEVVTRAVAGAGGAPAVEVEIRDRGPGIPRADLGKIFAPGYTTKPRGSGIGLAVANRVVAAHHGRILLDSEEGRGTTVTVVLPSDLGGFSSLAATTVARAEP